MTGPLCFVRHLMLIALVGWGVVDDLFPSTPNPLDAAAESSAYLPPETSGSRHERSLKSGAAHTRGQRLDASPGLLPTRTAVSRAALASARSGTGRLYALMSLQV
jgi:hypothetical protein